MPSHTSETLKSRNFVGLLSSQFLAAFNDHASQLVAIFYASDMLVRYANVSAFGGGLVIDEKLIVAIVTACFITPFFFFSPVAGILADKYSKRNIIVFWKMAEVAIMALALVGFILPHLQGTGLASPEQLAATSAWILVATVFLMGTHSAFFVPAKYGVMPEILHPSVLSRGNGLLEGTSFVAQILGTAFGGVLYGSLHSNFTPGGELRPGGEWLIGVVLLSLALVGALASLLIGRLPAAAPHRKLIWQPWVPLKASFAILARSRSLVLATIGIAFFLFMTLFLRQTLLFEGEAAKELAHGRELFPSSGSAPVAHETNSVMDLAEPEGASAEQKAEFRVSMLIALVGLGVGIGCSLAGYFSGSRLELGLVPIGAFLLVLLTAALGWTIGHMLSTCICLLLVGLSAGLYIVPLYTLLQHRAPKESKGSLVALSNFLNVAGGLIAVIVFYFMTYGLQVILGLDLSAKTVVSQPELQEEFLRQLEMQMNIPRILFVLASLITAAMLYLLCRQRPDFVVRAITWISSAGRRHLRASGLENMPGDGPVILATNCAGMDQMMDLAAVTDRFIRFFNLDSAAPVRGGVIAYFARRSGMIVTCRDETPQDYELILNRAVKTLAKGHIVAIVLPSDGRFLDDYRLLDDLHSHHESPVLPVHCSIAGQKRAVVIGQPLEASASTEEIRAALAALEPSGLEMNSGTAHAI